MGNRKPCSFILVLPKLTASLRAPRFLVLSLHSPPLSNLGNSLQLLSGCFFTGTETGHRGTSSDPKHHACCTQAGKRSHLVSYECICTASVPKLADLPSGCGVAQVEPAWSCPLPLAEACLGSTHLTLVLWSWSSAPPAAWHCLSVPSPGTPPEPCRWEKRRCGSSQEQEHLRILPCSRDSQSMKLHVNNSFNVLPVWAMR